MEKGILNQYIDACELIRETEEDLRRLKKRRRTIVQASVKGSMHDFPYAAKSFHMEGVPYSVYKDPGQVEQEERLLEQRKQEAAEIKLQVDAWMNTIPVRMQRIIRYKVFQKLPWEQVAVKMGRGATGESVKKEYQRFMEEN